MSCKLCFFAALVGLATAGASPALAVFTPGPGVTVIPLPAYNAAQSIPADTLATTSEQFDTTGGSSFQLTSLATIGDTVTFRADYFVSSGVGETFSTQRLFFEAGVGVPLAAVLPSGAQRSDPNQTPGVVDQYNSLGLNDLPAYAFDIASGSDFAAGDFTIGNSSVNDSDMNNGAGADTMVAGGLVTLSSTITRTGASTFSRTSTIEYRYVDDPTIVIASATNTAALAFPAGGTQVNTFYTPLTRLSGAPATSPTAYTRSITDATLTFTIIPDPSSLVLLAVGATGMLWRRRRA